MTIVQSARQNHLPSPMTSHQDELRLLVAVSSSRRSLIIPSLVTRRRYIEYPFCYSIWNSVPNNKVTDVCGSWIDYKAYPILYMGTANFSARSKSLWFTDIAGAVDGFFGVRVNTSP